MSSSDLRRPASFSTLNNNIKYASDEYRYFKDNEQFSYRYVDEFIDKMLQNELIPDMLIETLSEMTVDENNVNKFPLKSDRYVREPSQTRYMPVQMSYDGQGLASDNLVDDVYYKNSRRAPVVDKNELNNMLVEKSMDGLILDELLNKVKAQNRVVKLENYSDYPIRNNTRIIPNPYMKHPNSYTNGLPSLTANKNSYKSLDSLTNLEYLFENNNSLLIKYTDEFIYETLKNDILPDLIQDIVERQRYERKAEPKIKPYSQTANGANLASKSSNGAFNSSKEDWHLINNARKVIQNVDEKLNHSNDDQEKLFDTKFLDENAAKGNNTRKPAPFTSSVKPVRLRKF